MSFVRRLARICAACVLVSCMPAIARAADGPIGAAKDDAFIAHRAGSDVWTIGSSTLELTVGLDATRALTLQRLSNPLRGRAWNISPAPDFSIAAAGERVTLGTAGGVAPSSSARARGHDRTS